MNMGDKDWCVKKGFMGNETSEERLPRADDGWNFQKWRVFYPGFDVSQDIVKEIKKVLPAIWSKDIKNMSRAHDMMLSGMGLKLDDEKQLIVGNSVYGKMDLSADETLFYLKKWLFRMGVLPSTRGWTMIAAISKAIGDSNVWSWMKRKLYRCGPMGTGMHDVDILSNLYSISYGVSYAEGRETVIKHKGDVNWLSALIKRFTNWTVLEEKSESETEQRTEEKKQDQKDWIKGKGMNDKVSNMFSAIIAVHESGKGDFEKILEEREVKGIKWIAERLKDILSVMEPYANKDGKKIVVEQTKADEKRTEIKKSKGYVSSEDEDGFRMIQNKNRGRKSNNEKKLEVLDKVANQVWNTVILNGELEKHKAMARIGVGTTTAGLTKGCGVVLNIGNDTRDLVKFLAQSEDFELVNVDKSGNFIYRSRRQGMVKVIILRSGNFVAVIDGKLMWSGKAYDISCQFWSSKVWYILDILGGDLRDELRLQKAYFLQNRVVSQKFRGDAKKNQLLSNQILGNITYGGDSSATNSDLEKMETSDLIKKIEDEKNERVVEIKELVQVKDEKEGVVMAKSIEKSTEPKPQRPKKVSAEVKRLDEISKLQMDEPEQWHKWTEDEEKWMSEILTEIIGDDTHRKQGLMQQFYQKSFKEAQGLINAYRLQKEIQKQVSELVGNQDKVIMGTSGTDFSVDNIDDNV